MVFKELLHVKEHTLHVVDGIRRTRGTKEGVAPKVLIPDFGDCDFELTAGLVEEAAEDLSLVFQRAAASEAEVEHEYADDHG